MRTNKIKKVWFDNNFYLAKNASSVDLKHVEERISAIFCPGPFYYYVFDFSTYEFVTVSDSYQSIIGLDPKTMTIDKLLSRIHPDDIDFFTKCEAVIAKFLFEFLEPAQILDYKINYCFRNLTADNTYKLFLHQVTTISLDKDGKLEKVMGVHADISHITKVNSKKLSLLGLNGQPSYTNIDVYKDGIDFKATLPELTKREIEVLRLIADGATTSSIAKALSIAEPTVRKHRENLLKKTGAKNTSNLVARGIRNGII